MNSFKTTYILDENDRLTGEVTGNNTTVFLYDEGGLVYGFLYNDIPYFYLFNGQGDVVNVVDETGAVVASYNYDAWGNPISASGAMAAVNPIRYRGYYYDAETGLYYCQSRYYDPAVGRFINADGIFDENYQLIGYNMYAYARNAPTVFSDPSGEKIVIADNDPHMHSRLIMAYLQKLTNDTLVVNNHQVSYNSSKWQYISNRTPFASGTKPYGTLLIRELINSKYVYKIIILKGAPKGDNISHASTSNYGPDLAFVYINLQQINKNQPGQIILGHELIHVYRNLLGRKFIWGTYFHYYAGDGSVKSAKMEELFTVGIWSPECLPYVAKYATPLITENVLRREQGLPPRLTY